LDSLLVSDAGRKTAAAATPEGFQVESVGGEDGHPIARLNEGATQTGEVRLGAAQRRRIALHEMSDPHGRNPLESPVILGRILFGVAPCASRSQALPRIAGK